MNLEESFKLDSPLKKERSLVDNLIAEIPSAAASVCVRDIEIGSRYLGLVLENGACGLCHNMSPPGWQDRLLELKSTFEGRPAGEAAKYLRSPDLVLSALGLAAVNAAINNSITHFSEGDVLEDIKFNPDDKVAMVGFFAPLVPKIKSAVSRFDVFDLRYKAPEVVPQSKQAEILERASVVIVTATSLVNKTADKVLSFAKAAREICFLGPSQPLAPEPFRKRGVTLISGVQVVDVNRAFEIISAGGGTRELKDTMRKLNIRLNE
jgi:uncharacterized protein (DUF4213/DUF364 family)